MNNANLICSCQIVILVSDISSVFNQWSENTSFAFYSFSLILNIFFLLHFSLTLLYIWSNTSSASHQTLVNQLTIHILDLQQQAWHRRSSTTILSRSCEWSHLQLNILKFLLSRSRSRKPWLIIELTLKTQIFVTYSIWIECAIRSALKRIEHRYYECIDLRFDWHDHSTRSTRKWHFFSSSWELLSKDWLHWKIELINYDQYIEHSICREIISIWFKYVNKSCSSNSWDHRYSCFVSWLISSVSIILNRWFNCWEHLFCAFLCISVFSQLIEANHRRHTHQADLR